MPKLLRITESGGNNDSFSAENSSRNNQSTNQIVTSLSNDSETKTLNLNDASAMLKMFKTDAKCNMKGQYGV